MFSLCRQLLSSVRERYSLNDDVIVGASRWTTTEKGIHYPRESAVLGVIYRDSNNKQSPVNPHEVQST